ncbi:RNA-binding protein [Lactiplantibacillus plantarum]|nr:KH domain-containing protein [Lactiplantibacillus plantarum]PHY38603.1 RNA-binding protein [Lactiplantibacillus plantarum]
MADIKALITTVVTPLVQYPDDIKVDFKETTRYLEYNLTVNPEDIGRVIGRQGRVASAIRTIVYSVRVSGPKRVRLTIEDGQQKKTLERSSDVLFKSFFISCSGF